MRVLIVNQKNWQRSCAVVSVLEVLALLTLLIQVYKLGKRRQQKRPSVNFSRFRRSFLIVEIYAADLLSVIYSKGTCFEHVLFS